MSNYLRATFLLLLSLPLIANAGIHGRFGGGGYYHGGYYGPHGYYGPYYHGYYGYYGYYGPAFYGPAYYYAPPATVYEEPETIVVQAPVNYWYYCQSAKAYFPYVKECASGWQAVPAQGGQQQQPTSQAAPAPAQASAAPAAPPGTVVYRFGDLLFASGKADLQPAAKNSLGAMLTAIKKDPSHHITIEGHTDSSGDAVANHELSQRRAEAVKQFLVGHGVAADRIDAVGKGADAPIAGNDTVEGRKLNRRVDVIVG